MDIRERNQELQHLEAVKGKLQRALLREQEDLKRQKDELVEERRRMWEESAHNVLDFDDIIDMAIYDEKVRESHGHYVRMDRTVRQIKYLQGTPYFGRIDFAEEGYEPEQIYIGRYGFCEKGKYEYDIYDWRSPIANMFYECVPGPASYTCPAGELGGELTCKRQYRIRDGRLEYYYDTKLAVRDELLGKVLSENTDTVLRVIIDTITKEQNAAIRRPVSADLLITGPAGSGKTSVGMHRLAYLLYQNRENLSSDRIVVLSRNQIFSSYIAGILPELGEENVRDVLFDELIQKGIPKEYHRRDVYEQAEYLLHAGEGERRRQSVALKYSNDFLAYGKDYVADWKKKYAWELPYAERTVEKAAALYLEILRTYCERGGTASTEKQKDASQPDVMEVYRYTGACLRKCILYYEDMLVLGYIRILLGWIRPIEQVSHVVLDEAQDYSSLQLTILKLLYSRSRFTILADANQTVLPEVSTTEPEAFARIFGHRLQEYPLTKSYRSTAQINAFAFDLLGIHDESLYVDRQGRDPVLLATADMGRSINELVDFVPRDMSVAILTCDKASALAARKILGNYVGECRRRVEYLLKPDRELTEKTVVMPALLAKGLEFDVVIVWDDKTADYWARNKRLKYLMCTRALHELYLVTTVPCDDRTL